jgi:hypothetical protein
MIDILKITTDQLLIKDQRLELEKIYIHSYMDARAGLNRLGVDLKFSWEGLPCFLRVDIIFNARRGQLLIFIPDTDTLYNKAARAQIRSLSYQVAKKYFYAMIPRMTVLNSGSGLVDGAFICRFNKSSEVFIRRSWKSDECNELYYIDLDFPLDIEDMNIVFYQLTSYLAENGNAGFAGYVEA